MENSVCETSSATDMTCIALIPARSGSRRIPKKNILPFFGHPLLAYTIDAAKKSGIYSDIIVSTDSEKIATIAKKYGAEVPFLRPAEYAQDLSADIEWVEYTLTRLQQVRRIYDCYSILRPTNPFRTSMTIQKAWKIFCSNTADSLRAVDLCSQHPGKMWKIHGQRLIPLLPQEGDVPMHSTPYQALPTIYAQNASLEIAKTFLPITRHTISGSTICPYISEGYEGYDINTEKDLVYARYLVRTKRVILPHIV